MHDPYSHITDADPQVLDVLIQAMELRAADPRQRAIREDFISAAALPEGARVLEAGCGSGAVCRELARRPGVTEVVGLDDPLQACAGAAIAGLVNDRWLVRRLPAMVTSAGFEIGRLESCSYVQTSSPDYMLTLVDRGADLLVGSVGIYAELAEDLKREARRRVDDGRFFGFIAFAGLIARRPE